MTVDASVLAAESDPVSAALADPVVNGRLLAAARAFLGRRADSMPVVRRTAEAEEIVSKARVEAFRRRAAFDPTRDVVIWLIGFVRNVTCDHVKQYARTPSGPPPDAPRLEDLAVDLGGSVEDAVADRELASRVLADLPADDRELLQQQYFDGLSSAEIAARRGTTANAVRVRCHRIVERLRVRYGNGGEVQS